MMNTVSQARLRRDLNNVMSQVDSLLTTLGEEGNNSLQSLRERAYTAASSAKDKLTAINDTVTESTKQAVKVTDDYVHENPWRSIGIGAAAGLLIGFLAARR
jgi:ElaB/YqjD/DUF883 family membrane-anchored ribosome-binding protein